MINLKEIEKFRRLPDGGAIALSSDKRREVRLEVNAAEPCQLQLERADGSRQFLANVEGRETLLFIAEGRVVVRPTTEGEFWWWSPEVASSVVAMDQKSFTKIATRRQRNPELERMMRTVQLNAERRMQQVLGDVQTIVAAQAKEIEALKATEAKRGKRAKPSAAAASAAAADDAGAVDAPPADGDSGGGGDDAN